MATNNHYDLKQRTRNFGETIVKYCLDLPRNSNTSPLIVQLVRSGTSIGANYCEADNAESRSDFKHKIGIVKKEANETVYWLGMIDIAIPSEKTRTKIIRSEATELHLIFCSIYNKCS